MIVVQGERPREFSAQGMQRGRVVYVSLSSVAQALTFRENTSRDGRSIIITSPSRETKFTAGNPFVTVTHADNRTVTLQLGGDAVLQGSSFYIPAAASAPMFDSLFGIPAAFDAAARTLRIGKQMPPKPAFDIPSLSIEPKANGLLIRIHSSKPLRDCESLLKDDGWLYVTIPAAKIDVAAIDRIKPAFGVKKIITTQFRTSVQLAFRLDGKFVASEITNDPASNDVVVTLRARPDETKAVVEERKRPVPSPELDEQRKKYLLDVIVLDAGHGGKDPGTIGVTGTKEKDVALGIVLKLGRLIKKNLKDVKVVYTREDDTFIELDRRGKIANEANGKLFISVHCNAMPRKPSRARGFEVYLLRPGRSDEAIAIAERENSVIQLEEGFETRYQKLTDENFILVTMAQSAHMRASEVFAELLTKEMEKRLKTKNNGVLQAGFLVLVGSAMPNVLIETAYLSNREDEKLLKSQEGQQQYAEAIFNAIKRYKAEHEKLLHEGADLGEK